MSVLVHECAFSCDAMILCGVLKRFESRAHTACYNINSNVRTKAHHIDVHCTVHFSVSFVCCEYNANLWTVNWSEIVNKKDEKRAPRIDVHTCKTRNKVRLIRIGLESSHLAIHYRCLPNSSEERIIWMSAHKFVSHFYRPYRSLGMLKFFGMFQDFSILTVFLFTRLVIKFWNSSILAIEWIRTTSHDSISHHVSSLFSPGFDFRCCKVQKIQTKAFKCGGTAVEKVRRIEKKSPSKPTTCIKLGLKIWKYIESLSLSAPKNEWFITFVIALVVFCSPSASLHHHHHHHSIPHSFHLFL